MYSELKVGTTVMLVRNGDYYVEKGTLGIISKVKDNTCFVKFATPDFLLTEVVEKEDIKTVSKRMIGDSDSESKFFWKNTGKSIREER